MKNVAILLAAAAMLALAAPASGQVLYSWKPVTGYFNNADNWTTGIVPGPLDTGNVRAGLGNICKINTVQSVDKLSVGYHMFPGEAELLTGGSLTVGYLLTVGSYSSQSGVAYPGKFTQFGGTVNALNCSIAGGSADNPGTGRYTISGGNLTVAGYEGFYLGDSHAPGPKAFRIEGTWLFDDGVNPPTVPGVITVGPAYMQHANSTLEIVLNSSGAVTPININAAGGTGRKKHSFLEGTLALDASLYTPTVGRRVPVVALTNTGALLPSNLLIYKGGSVPPEGGALGHTATALTLSAPAGWKLIDNGLGELSVKYILGDVTEDNFVGQADLQEVLAKWGQIQVLDGVTARWLGDPTCDEFVGQADLQEVLAAWGQGTPPPPSIPEPATMTLLVLGGIGALLRRRKR